MQKIAIQKPFDIWRINIKFTHFYGK